MKKFFLFHKIKQLANYIGFWVDDDGKLPYSYNIADYITTDQKKLLSTKSY